jgi:hypothetical protein
MLECLLLARQSEDSVKHCMGHQAVKHGDRSMHENLCVLFRRVQCKEFSHVLNHR